MKPTAMIVPAAVIAAVVTASFALRTAPINAPVQAPAQAANGAPLAPPAATLGDQQVRKPRQYKIVPPTVYPGATVAFPTLKTFVQGTPSNAYAPGKIYVFECFATTCGHCSEAAPLVDEIVKEYAPKGWEFISITSEDDAIVRAWLDKPEIKEQVTQSVATDPTHSAQRILQDPTYQVLTPRFFVVRDGVVLWYGHPDVCDEPFKAIADGSWKPESIKQEFVTNALAARARNQINAMVTQCEKDGKWDALYDLLDSMAVAIPDRASTFELQKFGTMIGPAGNPKDGYAYGKQLAVKYATDIASLRTLARTTLNSPQVEKRDLDFAFDIARAADALGKGEDARASEILALAYFSRGDRDKAVELQTRAIAQQTNAKLKVIYTTQLDKYKKDEPKPVAYVPRKAPAGKPAEPKPADAHAEGSSDPS